MNAENGRLQDADEQKAAWKKWGPYLSERQWGTVREDYSENGDAWNYFTHDHARSRAYRWGSHEQHPYSFDVHGERHEVKYLPAESDTGMFGGNSNWRGPIWLPVNMLILRGLLQFYLYYGDTFKIECPTGSGRMMNLFEVTMELSRRLTRIFLGNEKGRRAVYAGTEKFQTDPHWRDYVLYYEYFHGDNGAGLGAGHQTGWTGLVAKLIQMLNVLDPQKVLKGSTRPVMTAR